MLSKLNQNECLEVSKRENGVLYRGFVGNSSSLLAYYLGYGNFTEIPEYANYPYRRVFVDSENKTTFTYCEGDISFKVCEDLQKELEEMDRFYSEY